MSDLFKKKRERYYELCAGCLMCPRARCLSRTDTGTRAASETSVFKKPLFASVVWGRLAVCCYCCHGRARAHQWVRVCARTTIPVEKKDRSPTLNTNTSARAHARTPPPLSPFRILGYKCAVTRR